MIEIALFEPEIPQNTGTLMRLATCFDVKINLIQPFGFILSSKKLQRAGMDYLKLANYQVHESYEHFIRYTELNLKRVVKLIPNKGKIFTDFQFDKNDIIVGGRESNGFPEHINNDHHTSVYIPSKGRSINLAIATSIVTSEALRQVGFFNI